MFNISISKSQIDVILQFINRMTSNLMSNDKIISKNDEYNQNWVMMLKTLQLLHFKNRNAFI